MQAPITANAMTAPVRISAVILTHNEARNIGPCLAALRSVDDVVIVDSGSSDDTLALARAVRPEVRIYHHPFKDFGDQRNWAIDHTDLRHEWLLFVDADEYCDPELLDEISAFISNPMGFVGGFIAGRNYFLGRWLKYSTMYPSYQLRLLQRGSVRYVKDGHGQREVTDGALKYLKHGWRHEAFSKGVHQWLSRHNTYSTEEARRFIDARAVPIDWSQWNQGRIARRRLLKQIALRLPLRPWIRFAYAWIVRGGILDGRPGFYYCTLLLAHQLEMDAKIAEIAANAADTGGGS